MPFNFKYSFSQAGDVFFSAVQKTADSVILCYKGATLTYDINTLNYRKQQISRNIGERVAYLVQDGTIEISSDSHLSDLVAQLDTVEKEIASFESERVEVFNHFKCKKQ